MKVIKGKERLFKNRLITKMKIYDDHTDEDIIINEQPERSKGELKRTQRRTKIRTNKEPIHNIIDQQPEAPTAEPNEESNEEPNDEHINNIIDEQPEQSK